MKDVNFIKVPLAILSEGSLSYFEKVLLSEILTLLNGTGKEYCWPSNKYLAEKFGDKERAIQKGISSLKEKEYIKARYEYSPGTKKIIKRFISVPDLVRQNRYANEDLACQNEYAKHAETGRDNIIGNRLNNNNNNTVDENPNWNNKENNSQNAPKEVSKVNSNSLDANRGNNQGIKTISGERAFVADSEADKQGYIDYLFETVKNRPGAKEALFMQNKIDSNQGQELWRDFIQNSIVNVRHIENEKHAWNLFKKFITLNGNKYQGIVQQVPQNENGFF